jgi:membrane protein implicated in regulation of membrane protease activity
MKMSRVKRIAIGIPVVLGVDLAVYLFIPQPFSLITTAIVVVLVLDWLWNRRKNMEYTQDENGTYDRQQKSET